MKISLKPKGNHVGWVIPFLLVLTWELSFRIGFLPSSQAAPPSIILQNLAILLLKGTLSKHLVFSVKRLFIAITLGTLLGIISGVMLATLKWADKLLTPTIQFLAGIPVVVYMPFWILIFKTGEGFKIGLAATATYFLVNVHTFQATRGVAMRYIEVANIYEKNYIEIFYHILLPSIIPSILTGLRLSVAIGWIVIFFVEYAVSKEGTEGLGWFIADARQNGRIEDEFSGMILLGITGYLIDITLAKFQKRSLVWSDTLETDNISRGISI